MAGLVPAIHVFSFRARGLPPDDRLRYADAEPRAARSLRAASRRHEGCIMKGLLAGATLVVAILLVGAAAFAQGACSRACASAGQQCQRNGSELGAACGRACGKRASCVAACEKQQVSVAAECARQYRFCVRGCGGR
jgi:hypothetical protein